MAKTASGDQAHSAAPRPRVLYAEDSPVDLELVRFLLSKMGVDMIAAQNGPEALVRLEEQPLDLIFIDLWLPILTGLEIIDTIRERGIDTPIVLVTADDERTLWEQAREKGAIAVLHKPFTFDGLVTLLRDHLTKPLQLPNQASPPSA